MKCMLLSPVIVLALAATCATGNSRLPGQVQPGQRLPAVEDILDKEAEAVGGKAANNVKTFVMKAQITVEDQQVELVVYHAGLKKQCMQISSEEMGMQEIVVNGDRAWIKTSDGSTMLDGEERTAAFRKAEEFGEIFQRIGNWRKQFKQVQLIGEDQVDGKPAYKVAVTTQTNESWMDYYDKKTGLLVQCEVTMEGPYGTEGLVISFGDYRKVNGITHAFTTRITGGPEDIVVTIESMAHNVDISEERFALPPDLRPETVK